MNKYEQIKKQQEKLRILKQQECDHARLDMVVIKRRCFDCGLDVCFRDEDDTKTRGHIGRGDTSY